MPEPEKEKHKRSFTQEERKAAMDLFNSFESGQFKVLVLEAGNDKNAEKGAAWDRFTAAFREVCFSYLNFVDICNRFLKKKCSFPSSVADPDPWNPYHFPGSGSGSI